MSCIGSHPSAQLTVVAVDDDDDDDASWSDVIAARPQHLLSGIGSCPTTTMYVICRDKAGVLNSSQDVRPPFTPLFVSRIT